MRHRLPFGKIMETATVSSKFQLVVPRGIREKMGLKPGERLAFVLEGRTLHLVPVESLDALRGRMAGASTEDVRDRSDA